MKFRNFLEEQTTSTKIAGYEPTADNAETEDVIDIKIENMEMIEKIYSLAEKYNLAVERPRKTLEKGDTIKLRGAKESIEKLKKEM
ncbi:MAG: hypothetical protein ACOCP4_01615 [Candidatus Woesearchaeota archaeon]